MANLQAAYTQQRHRRALGGASLRTGRPRQATCLAVLNSYDPLRSLQPVAMHQVSGRPHRWAAPVPALHHTLKYCFLLSICRRARMQTLLCVGSDVTWLQVSLASVRSALTAASARDLPVPARLRVADGLEPCTGSGRAPDTASNGLTARQLLGKEEQLRSLVRGQSLNSTSGQSLSSLQSNSIRSSLKGVISKLLKSSSLSLAILACQGISVCLQFFQSTPEFVGFDGWNGLTPTAAVLLDAYL